jgi:hypothetical protein
MKEQYKTWGAVKTFQVSEFLYHKMSLEDVFPKDKPDNECMDELEARIEAQARRKYPHLFSNGKKLSEEAFYGVEEQVPQRGITIVPPKEKLSQVDTTILAINTCKTIKDLKSFNTVVQFTIKKTSSEKDKQKLQEAYDKKMDELTNKETV